MYLWEYLSDHIEETVGVYKRLLDEGAARETARMVLPQAAKTTLFMTGSVRNWIHLIQLRDDQHAQKEAQEIAREVKRIFCDEYPIVADAVGFTS